VRASDSVSTLVVTVVVLNHVMASDACGRTIAASVPIPGSGPTQQGLRHAQILEHVLRACRADMSRLKDIFRS
jgi:hypothetical protein